MNNSKQIKNLLSQAPDLLPDSTTPRLDLEVLITAIFSWTRSDLIINQREELPIDKFDKLMDLVEQRRAYQPIAYILNNKEFYGREFYVDRDVLVPRPETELLVDLAIREFKDNSNKKDFEILDLGTGSGCIVVTLAKELSSTCSLTAVDSSVAALEVAKKNAATHCVSDRIDFIQSDWFQNLQGKKFDLIISNPPYVNAALEGLSPELKHEPSSALYASEQGLTDVKFLISNFKSYAKPTATFLCEIGSEQKDALAEYCESLALQYQFHKDLAGLDRVLELKLES